MDEVLIYIFPSSAEDGYVWDVYKDDYAYDEGECFDGGVCTGTFEDTIELALEAIREKGKLLIKD